MDFGGLWGTGGPTTGYVQGLRHEYEFDFYIKTSEILTAGFKVSKTAKKSVNGCLPFTMSDSDENYSFGGFW